MTGCFRPLLALFRNRFFESESGVSDFEANIYQALGLIAIPGLLVSMFLLPHFMELSFRPPGPAVDWALRSDRLFFPTYSFCVVAFLTIFEWDMLFPDRQDFLILSSFPIRMRDVFLAKLSALGLFLGGVMVAANGFSVLLMPVFMAYIKQANAAGVYRLIVAQIAATGIAALLAFFAIAAIQGILINVFSPAVFRKIQNSIQAAGMSAAVLCLLLFPVYSASLQTIAQDHPRWLGLFPPFWLVGVYDLVLPGYNSVFESLGLLAVKALAVTIGVFCITWIGGFSRYYRRTLECDIKPDSRELRASRERWPFPPEERGIYRFIAITLARSSSHRLFLATYLSVGLALGLVFTVAIDRTGIPVSPDGLRAFPLILAFFTVSGFRAAFQVPVQYQANWLFRITEAGWAQKSRDACRKMVLVAGLMPVLIIFALIGILTFGWQVAVFHFLFQLFSGALLIEVMLWDFDKVPFTCSYSPGRLNLAILAGLYFYGFTSYGFRMAELEQWLETRKGYALLFLAGAWAMQSWLSRRTGAKPNVRFDSAEPEIQTLDLS